VNTAGEHKSQTPTTPVDALAISTVLCLDGSNTPLLTFPHLFPFFASFNFI
jgi:hypothetical protein